MCGTQVERPTTLVIDTSFGSTVAVAGYSPVSETDSRTHVERLQLNIAQALRQVDGGNLKPQNINRIVVGTGPAPFTGLRAGIVAAKALAFATGAQLLGQDILEPLARHVGKTAVEDSSYDSNAIICTLAVNDARRKQLYFRLYRNSEQDEPQESPTVEKPDGHRYPADQIIMKLPAIVPLCDIDIDDPSHIVQRVNQMLSELQNSISEPDDVLHGEYPELSQSDIQREHSAAQPALPGIVLHVVGKGAEKYKEAWTGLQGIVVVDDRSIMQIDGGVLLFTQCALEHFHAGDACSADPLYVRRPDVSVPNPLKHVLSHSSADRVD